MQLSENSILQGGKYRIIRPLGQGGFGITYEAEQVALHRRVAIKEFFMKEYCDRDSTTSHVTLGTSEGSKDLVERFKSKFVREAQMIAGFDNPHIIRIYDIFEENGTAYYVMAFLDGGSLADMVKKEGLLSEEKACDYIKQVGNALDYIHKRNVLHLDVKPSNILLNSSGEAVLIDFGISKHYDSEGSQTSTTPAGISKGYAPMEQYQQGNIAKFSPATDVYSLGATLYFLLTGEVPPEAAEVYEEGLPVIKANVSAKIKEAIENAMAPKRKDRPQSIGAFNSILSNSDSSGKVDHLEKPKKSHPEDELTRLNKPQPSGTPQHGEETEYAKPLPQTPTPAPAPTQPMEQPKKKTTGFALTVFLFLVGFLTLLFSYIRNNDGARSTDAIYIDGAPSNDVVVWDSMDILDESSSVKLIDMGVSVLWADRNIGAQDVYDYGLNYNWGVTDVSGKEKAPSDLNSYPSNISGTKYDIATTAYGDGWRIPSLDDYNELLRNSDLYRYEQNEVSGYLLISKTTKQRLFFPNYKRYEIKGDPTSAMFNSDAIPVYWTSNCTKSYNGGFVFWFEDGQKNAYRTNYYLPIRAVKNKN